ncbi:MAG: restriction endonuclease subunit S [Rhodocyclaceae bacterium]|nr:restriction endonuclease subunit S [Rhodocyclaceae bacterium]
MLKVSDLNDAGNETAVVGCRLETTRGYAASKRLRIVPRGAVVFPKRGGAIATNKKRILGISAALDPNMMGVFPLEDSGLTSEFLRWWFESIDLAEIQEDGGIPQINKKHIGPLEIPLPTPVEQEHIVAHLESLWAKLNQIRGLQNDAEIDLAALLPSILAKAFRGEL